MVALYWQIGERIKREVSGDERATYGKKILATLSQELTAEFGLHIPVHPASVPSLSGQAFRWDPANCSGQTRPAVPMGSGQCSLQDARVTSKSSLS